MVERVGKSCHVRAGFACVAPDSVVWNVLSDYEHIERFVKSVRSSRVEWRDHDHVMLRQDAVGSVLMFHRRVSVLLDVRETHGQRIRFRDVLGSDFASYVGEWRLAPDSSGTRVEYELATEPKGVVAQSMCRGVLTRTARDLLEQVRAEILPRMTTAP